MRHPATETDHPNQALATALAERMASERPMPRSLRRAYEQLMARASVGSRLAESAEG